MKKVLSRGKYILFSLFIMLYLLCSVFLLTSCGGKNHTEDTVNLPIVGHFTPMGEIFIETARITEISVAVPHARAYAYEDGKWHALKRYETQITISEQFTYGEYSGRDITLPIQYFVYHSKTYAYLNADKTSDLNIKELDIYPIPKKEHCILIDKLGAFSTLYVDLNSGDIKPVFREEMPLQGRVACVGDNAPYAAVICNMEGHEATAGYVIDLNDLSVKEIILPPYDETKYAFNDLYPLVFVDSRLYVWYRLFELDTDRGDKEGTLVYDVEKGTVEELAEDLVFYNSFNYSEYPYIQMNCDQGTGMIKVLNLKEGSEYSYIIYPSGCIGGSPNSTGQYLLCKYCDTPLAGYDENGEPYYANSLKTERHLLVDMKNQKRIDLSIVDSKLDMDNMTYDGTPCICYWVSETEIAVVTEPNKDGGEACIRTVINISSIN
ncbi:MAG: hypothetical protein E7525_05175 [Ruminococcaceae bacterium]|nr:hypothetical protein [Oscillospiraceae bacterium]